MMQNWQKRRTVYCMVVMLTIVMAFTMVGCDGDDDDFESVEPNELENKTFIFPNGEAFGFPGQRVTLEVRSFVRRDDVRVAPFIITTQSGTARGEIGIDEDDFTDDGLDLTPESECALDIVTTDMPQYTVGLILQFRPCDVHNNTGALRVVNDDDDTESTSLPPS